MNRAYDALALSPRAYNRTLKVARTIADLDSSRDIKTEHLAEALGYRLQE
jgi:magnesium chelatase family protein